MRKLFILFSCLYGMCVSAQQVLTLPPEGGGSYPEGPSEIITEADRQQIFQMLNNNISMLRARGVDLSVSRTQAVSFSWPIRKAAGFTDNGFYGISNYVDHNTGYPNLVKDYNCGSRTYDLASGYNHKGTDIFSWPFAWDKMANNAVEVIAAAPGVIIGKIDGNFDQNCSFCTNCNWNAVYVQHADGSIAWYGHLKTGTLTNKALGQSVAAGEYLGVVGSSGSSTSPHLHFEVYTNSTYTQLVDPWNGACNSTNPGTGWWAAQEAYRVFTINTVMTHGAPPQINSCAAQEVPNKKTNFAPGETIYLGSYYRDQEVGQVYTHRIYYPDGTLWTSWNQSSSATYNASWWYYSRVLPTTGNINGAWRYEVSSGAQVVSTQFTINGTAPDLTLSNTAIQPSSVATGANLNVSFSINNNGTVAAGSHKVYFYLSTDNVFHLNSDYPLGQFSQVSNINAASGSGVINQSLNIPCGMAPGQYFVIAVVDGLQQVTESDENNNTAAVPLTITPLSTALNIVQGDTAICSNGSITLQATGSVSSFSWSPATGLNTTTGSTVTATPTVSTKYKVTGMFNGCLLQDSVMVSVVPIIFPALSISYSGCPSSTLLFQANGTNGGSSPQYQWYLNGIYSGVGPSFTINNAVNQLQVYARMTSSAACALPTTVQSASVTVNCITTSLPAVDGLESYWVSPNPTRGVVSVQLKLSGRKAVSFVLTDSKGRVVLRRAPVSLSGSTTQVLDLERMAAGTYILKMRIGEQEITEKLVKL